MKKSTRWFLLIAGIFMIAVLTPEFVGMTTATFLGLPQWVWWYGLIHIAFIWALIKLIRTNEEETA